MADELTPRFGDWFRNQHASETNPTRDGMYVRTIYRTGRLNPGVWWELTDGKGEFWTVPPKALSALKQQNGWVAVPREPTNRMLEAGIATMFVDVKFSEAAPIVKRGYKTMLSAAPPNDQTSAGTADAGSTPCAS